MRSSRPAGKSQRRIVENGSLAKAGAAAPEAVLLGSAQEQSRAPLQPGAVAPGYSFGRSSAFSQLMTSVCFCRSPERSKMKSRLASIRISTSRGEAGAK